MSIGKFLGFVERGQAAQRAADQALADAGFPNRPRMMYAGQCDEHGGYPGDALNRPALGDICICMTCGRLSLFKDRNRVREGRILPTAIDGLEAIDPPLDEHQRFMLAQILDAIKNRRGARAAAAH